MESLDLLKSDGSPYEFETYYKYSGKQPSLIEYKKQSD